MSRWSEHVAPDTPVEAASSYVSPRAPIVTPVLDFLGSCSSVAPTPTLKYIIVGPLTQKKTMVTVIPSLLKEQVMRLTSNPSTAPFRLISVLHINLDTAIPDYSNDRRLLIHLAFSLYPQFGDDALKKLALDYLEAEEEEEQLSGAAMEVEENINVLYEEDEENIVIDDDNSIRAVTKESSDEDLEILEEASAVFTTLGRKKKGFKYCEDLDESFLRCSRRLSKKADSYKDTKSAKEAKSEKNSSKKTSRKKVKKSAQVEKEPIPLTIIPP